MKIKDLYPLYFSAKHAKGAKMSKIKQAHFMSAWLNCQILIKDFDQVSD
jgi:hypothetical protein